MTNFIDINGLSAAINKAQDSFLWGFGSEVDSVDNYPVDICANSNLGKVEYFILLTTGTLSELLHVYGTNQGMSDANVEHIGGGRILQKYDVLETPQFQTIIRITTSYISGDTSCKIKIIPIDGTDIYLYINGNSEAEIHNSGLKVLDTSEPRYRIVSRAANNFTAVTENYYRFNANVGTITITLPTISADSNHVHSIFFYFTTSASPAITFSSTHTIKYYDSYEIEANKTYEVNALYNGAAWVITSSEISAT